MLLIRRHENFFFIPVLDMPISYLPAALMAEAKRLTAIPGAVALCYNILL
jgi:hypothetical protein